MIRSMSIAGGVCCAALLVGGSRAGAAPVVLGETEADRQLVSEHLGVEAGSITWLKPSEIRARRPWSDAGTLRTCEGPPARVDEVTADLQQAIQGLHDFRLADAEAAINRGEARLVCTGESLQRGQLWALFFLQGVLYVNLERPADAQRAFRTARNLDPKRPWNEDFPDSDGRDLFRAARDGSLTRVVLSPAPPSLRVDTLPIDLELPYVDLTTGQHLLQFGTEPALQPSLLFDPTATAPTLVVPSLLPADAPAWTTPDLARDLARVLGRVLPEESELWVVEGRTLHHAPLSDLQWEQVPLPELPVPALPAPPARWTHYTAIGASAVAGAGVVGTGATALWAADARSRLEAVDDPAAFETLDASYDQVRTWNQVSIGVTVIAAATAVGAELLDRRPRSPPRSRR